jgi:hypothetical protein
MKKERKQLFRRVLSRHVLLSSQTDLSLSLAQLAINETSQPST